MRKVQTNSAILIFALLGVGLLLSGFGSPAQASIGPEVPPPVFDAQTVPTCLDRSDIPNSEYHWLHVPAVPGELATSEYYGYLAGQLIIYGVVDASDCPLGGVWPTGYANACGLEATREEVIYLQNLYDEEILDAYRTVGTPPVLLKQLLRYESQFWPVRMGVYHFGLGHLTLIGAANALLEPGAVWRGLLGNLQWAVPGAV